MYAKMNGMKRGSQGFRRTVLSVVSMLEIALIALTPAVAFAQQASSTNYSVNEAFFGTGGQLCDPGVSGNSTNYCAKTSVGELGVGNTSSTNYQSQAGFNTNREEYIELIMNNASECGTTSNLSQSLGILSAGSRTTYMTYFSVKTYLATAGYVVRTTGAAPSITGGGGYTLATPNSGAGTNPAGTERFGINLVANSNPSVGVNPVQIPSSSTSFGQAANGYDTANSFRYVNNEAIANSNGKSSGSTCYTMSYLFNISGQTPAGEYKFNQSLVATSTY